MFYLHLHFVILAVFLASVLTAELFMTSSEERYLPPLLKIAGGYIFQAVYFVAALEFFSIRWAWGLGFILLLGTLLGRSRANLKAIYDHLMKSRRSYIACFVSIVLGVNFFLLPLHLGRNYGPFTEGGGDVSIYADFSRYITDHDRSVANYTKALKSVNAVLGNSPVTNKFFDFRKGNPPDAEYQAYRLAFHGGMSSIAFSRVAAWFFLSPETNYSVYYAVQAFEYVLTLVCIGSFFMPYGVLPPLLALSIFVCSHGFISTSFNQYSVQALVVMLLAFVLAILPRIKLWSFAGLRTYGFATLLTVSYPHCLSLVLPLLIVQRLSGLSEKMRGSPKKMSIPVGKRAIVEKIAAFVFFGLILLWFGALSVSSFNFIFSLIERFSSYKSAAVSLYFGNPISYFSVKWLNLFLGLVSQQHFPPFIIYSSFFEVFQVMPRVGIAVNVIGLVILALGFYTTLVLRSKQLELEPKNSNFRISVWALYLISLITILVHLFVAGGTFYGQAKAAQNALVLTYAVLLVLPFAVLTRATHKSTPSRIKLLRGHSILLFLLCGCFLVPRIYFCLRLAHGMDRSTILETSYFQAAQKIRREDPNCFVLFEPRNSADLYLSSQSFFGTRMIPTRHLTLQLEDGKEDILDSFSASQNKNVIPSDLISAQDLSHIWTLESRILKSHHSRVFGDYSTFTWVGKKLSLSTKPVVLLFGNQYERDFNRFPVSKNVKDSALFSFVNHGSSMVWVPPFSTRSGLVVRLRPRDPGHFEHLKKEIQGWIDSTQPSTQVIADDALQLLTLRYLLPPSKEGRLLLAFRYSEEVFVSLELDGKAL